MKPLSTDLSFSLTQNFQAVYEALDNLAADAAVFHGQVEVNDQPSRDLYTALTRFLAFSDQMQMTLSLMREEVHAMERVSWQRVCPLGGEQLEERYYEWLYAAQGAEAKVN